MSKNSSLDFVMIPPYLLSLVFLNHRLQSHELNLLACSVMALPASLIR
jgi:hypothetical protein